MFKSDDFLNQSSLIEDCIFDILKNVLLCLTFHCNGTSTWKNFKTCLNLMRNTLHRSSNECSKSTLIIIIFICLSYEIKHGQTGFTIGKTQTTTKLLQKNGQRFGRP